jgi:hypothetical protein
MWEVSFLNRFFVGTFQFELMLQKKLDGKMRLFSKIFAVLCGILLVLVLIESKNRKEFKVSSSDINTYVVSWHGAYYDSMGNWDVNNGSVILKVDYANLQIGADAIVSSILLEGEAIFTDEKTEKFSKKCERKWSTELDMLPDFPTNAISSEVQHDPVCFIIFDHSLPYKRKVGEKTISESNEQSRVMAEVAKTKIKNFKVSAWARKKPTKLEKDIKQKISLIFDWLKIPFERS